MVVSGLLRVDAASRSASLDRGELDLMPNEFELHALFAGHPGRAFSREYLLKSLWGYDFNGFDRTVDTRITRLRKKLGPLGEKSITVFVTVWSVGYRFAP